MRGLTGAAKNSYEYYISYDISAVMVIECLVEESERIIKKEEILAHDDEDESISLVQDSHKHHHHHDHTAHFNVVGISIYYQF